MEKTLCVFIFEIDVCEGRLFLVLLLLLMKYLGSDIEVITFAVGVREGFVEEITMDLGL